MSKMFYASALAEINAYDEDESLEDLQAIKTAAQELVELYKLKLSKIVLVERLEEPTFLPAPFFKYVYNICFKMEHSLDDYEYDIIKTEFLSFVKVHNLSDHFIHGETPKNRSSRHCFNDLPK